LHHEKDVGDNPDPCGPRFHNEDLMYNLGPSVILENSMLELLLRSDKPPHPLGCWTSLNMNYCPRQYNWKGVYHPNVVARNEVDWERRAVNSMRTRLQKKRKVQYILDCKKEVFCLLLEPKSQTTH
jgi:hypothetical protein